MRSLQMLWSAAHVRCQPRQLLVIEGTAGVLGEVDSERRGADIAHLAIAVVAAHSGRSV
jgi:hypothetical protein